MEETSSSHHVPLWREEHEGVERHDRSSAEGEEAAGDRHSLVHGQSGGEGGGCVGGHG